MNWVKIDNDFLDFTVDRFNETVNDPLAAAIEAVNDIVNNYPKPYNLLASGGIDSQAMIYAWKQSKHEFNVYSFRYNKNYNLHDIETLEIFCERENIDYQIVDFDYIAFLEQEHDTIAKKYKCSSPQITMHIKMASFLQGTRVYSGNFLGFNITNLSCAIMGLYRFSNTDEGKNVIPYFFLHTPELAYSFRNIKAMDNSESYERRVQQYQVGGFPVIPQEKKLTGFEKFKEHYDSHQYVLMDKTNRMRYHDKPSHRPFDWLFRYPYEKMFGDSPLSYVLNSQPLLIIE